MYCHDEENWFLWDKPIEPLLQELIPLRKLPIYRHNPSDVDILFQKDHVSVFLIDKTYLVACNASHFPIHLPSQNGSILVSTNPEADLSFLPPNSCFFAKLSL